MKRKLFNAIRKAIDQVIKDHAFDQVLWEGYIHETLTREMTKAAEQVFDASMNGQAYAEKERS